MTDYTQAGATQFESAPELAGMTKVYIDPTAEAGGNGSIERPYNTWENVIRWTPNTAFLQKAGTTYTGSVEIYGRTNGSLGQPYYLGAYGSGPKPRIVASPGTNYCIRLNNSGGGFIFDNLEIANSDCYGITFLVGNICEGFLIRNCDFYSRSTAIEQPGLNDTAQAIYIFLGSGKQLNDLTVEGCKFHSDTLYRDKIDQFNHIKIFQNDQPFYGFTVKNCEFNDIYGSAIRVFLNTSKISDTGFEAVRPSGVVIEGNVSEYRALEYP